LDRGTEAQNEIGRNQVKLINLIDGRNFIFIYIL